MTNTLTELLTKDLKIAARNLGRHEVRYLVSTYYNIQKMRKTAGMQMSRAQKAGLPILLLENFNKDMDTLEKLVARAMGFYSEDQPVGKWLLSQYGIGPVLASGLLAHIDITRAPYAGHIWSYAGWGGTGQKPWNKGEKRPWNADFRVLCFKIGMSMQYFHNRPQCYYGGFYTKKQAAYRAANERGDYAEIAAACVKIFNPTTVAYSYYERGLLPPAHIAARTRRITAKLFLSHLHHVMYLEHFHKEPPDPYAYAQLQHDPVSYIPPSSIPDFGYDQNPDQIQIDDETELDND